MTPTGLFMGKKKKKKKRAGTQRAITSKLAVQQPINQRNRELEQIKYQYAAMYTCTPSIGENQATPKFNQYIPNWKVSNHIICILTTTGCIVVYIK